MNKSDCSLLLLELWNNSLDAGAHQIDSYCYQDRNGNRYFTIRDDGTGLTGFKAAGASFRGQCLSLIRRTVNRFSIVSIEKAGTYSFFQCDKTVSQGDIAASVTAVLQRCPTLIFKIQFPFLTFEWPGRKTVSQQKIYAVFKQIRKDMHADKEGER